MPTVVVVGATGAVGSKSAAALHSRGVNVVLVGRNIEKLAELKTKLTSNANDTTAFVETVQIDFSSPKSIDSGAQMIVERHSEINGLVISTGIFLKDGPNPIDEDPRLDQMFTVCTLGPFIFLNHMIQRLEESHGHVVFVIAPGGAIDWDDLQSMKSYSAFGAFGRCKTLNIAVAGELSRRHNIVSTAFHPGFVKNNGAEQMGGVMGWVLGWASWLFAKDGVEAGEGCAAAVLDAEESGYVYVNETQDPAKLPAFVDVELGRRAWDALDALRRGDD